MIHSFGFGRIFLVNFVASKISMETKPCSNKTLFWRQRLCLISIMASLRILCVSQFAVAVFVLLLSLFISFHFLFSNKLRFLFDYFRSLLILAFHIMCFACSHTHIFVGVSHFRPNSIQFIWNRIFSAATLCLFIFHSFYWCCHLFSYKKNLFLFAHHFLYYLRSVFTIHGCRLLRF